MSTDRSKNSAVRVPHIAYYTLQHIGLFGDGRVGGDRAGDDQNGSRT